MPGYFGESKYLPFFGVYLTSWIESSKPNIRELACKRGLEAGLGYVDVFRSLAIFRVDAHSSLLLPTKQSLCELRLLAGDGLGAAHYLSDFRKHFIAPDGQSPGRLVEPGARQKIKCNNIFMNMTLVIHR